MMSPTLSVPGLDEGGRDRRRGPCRARPRRSCRSAVRFGLALSSWRSATSRIISISSSRPGPRLGRDRHERHVAAVLLDDDARLGQLGLDPVRVGVRLVDLVEGDDDRHLRRLGVADRLERLGHDAVVGGDHDDRDVGHPRAAGAHGGERLVARRVEEDDALAVVVDLARADVLGDAAALAGRDLGRPDRVEQARLAVVDVAHDGHDRGARLRARRVVLLEEDFLGRLGAGASPSASPAPAVDAADGLGDLVAELARDQRRGVAVDELVDGREDAALDELADDVRGVDGEQLGELLDGDGRGQLDRAALTRIERPGPAMPRMRRLGAVACAGRVGRGCRSYSWPRAPPSMSCSWCMAPDASARKERGRERDLRAPGSRAPLVMAMVDSRSVGGRRRRRDRPAGRSDRSRPPVRRADDPQELALRAVRPTGDAGAGRDAPRRRRTRPAAPTTPPPRWRPSRRPSWRALRLGRRRRLGRGGSPSRRSVASASACARRLAAAALVARFGCVDGGRRLAGGVAAAVSAPWSCVALRLGRLRRASARRAPRPSVAPARRRPSRAGSASAAAGGLGVGRGLRLGDRDVAADVDPPAGQPGGEPGVLALAADRQREHPLRHGDVRDAVLLVDVDADDLGRAERVGHEDGRVVAPRDDVDLLAGELGDDRLDAGAALADRGADRVEAVLARRDRDLRAAAGLARDGLDLDRAAVDLGDLELEEARAGSPCGSG